MAEPKQVEIATLNINYTKVIKASSDLKSQIDAIKKAQKQLTKEGKTSGDQFVKNEAQLKNLGKSYRDNQKFAAALTSSNKDLAKTMSTQNKSTQQLRDSRAKLNQISTNIKGNTEKEIKLRQDLNKAIDKQTEAIDEQTPGYVKQKDNIGNYEGALRKLSPQMAGMLDQLKSIKSGLIAQRAAMQATVTANTAASKSLKVLKFALISTGIGAIVVVLGTLITYLNTTQKGVDTLTKVTKPLEVIFQSLLGVIQGLGERLANVFSDPKQAILDFGNFIKQNLINRITALGGLFKSLGKIISSGFTDGYEDFANASLQLTTGVEDVIGKTKELAKNTGKFFGDAVAAGLELRQIAIDIEQKEAELVLTREKTLNLIKEQELIAKNTAKTGEERNDASNKAIQLSRELAKSEREIIDLKIKEEELNQSLNDSGREDLKVLNELKAEAIRKDTEDKARELRFLGAKSSLQKELVKEELARLKTIKDFNDQVAKDAEDDIDAFIEGNEKEIEAELNKQQILLDNNQIYIDNLIAQEAQRAADEKELSKDLSKFKEDLLFNLLGTSQMVGNARVANLQRQVDEGVITEKEGANKIAKVQRAQAVVGKAQALFSIGLSTAEAIVKALAILGPIFGPPAGIALGTLGAIQAASVVATPLPPIPKLAKGGRISGAGTETSDSIPALLSKNETIIAAKPSRMFAPLLSELNFLGGGNRFANGGIAGSTGSPASNLLVDYKAMGAEFSNALEGLKLAVGVDEISRVAKNVEVVENIATF